MKLVIDSTIPFICGIFEPFAEVVYKEGPEITHEDVIDAQGLIIRTRTRCDAEFLKGTSVKVIATATIGVDNIDTEFCRNNGIYFKNASGCNAGGVMNYVFSALFGCAARKSIPLKGATFGIIGAGSVGSNIESVARILGFNVLIHDTPRAAAEGGQGFCSLDELLAGSDIVSLHVPLNDKTRGIANAEFFSKMRMGAFFINSSNGDLVVEEDLIEAKPKLGPIAIDTWSGEPDVNLRLMNIADIATPHIAGYSLQGKLLGTALAVRTVARYFGIESLYEFFPQDKFEGSEAVKLDISGKSFGEIAALIQYNYPIFTDDFIFRMSPYSFSEIRDNYRYRREYYF